MMSKLFIVLLNLLWVFTEVTSFAGFLSSALCETDECDWKSVLKSVIGEKSFVAGFRQAKRKVDEDNYSAMCRTILCDWMKARPRQDDKIEPVLVALKWHRLYDLIDRCRHFVAYQRENLSDEVLQEIAERTSKGFDDLARSLNLDPEQIEACKKEHGGRSHDHVLGLLMAWRESEEVVKHGDKALEALKSACGV